MCVRARACERARLLRERERARDDVTYTHTQNKRKRERERERGWQGENESEIRDDSMKGRERASERAKCDCKIL